MPRAPLRPSRPPSVARPVQRRTVVLYKPFDVLSQFTEDQPGQRTLAEFDLPTGLYPAGRLDRDSEGLLLLSNDGPLIQRLLEPSFAHPRSYWVQVENIPDENALQTLRGGVSIRVGKSMVETAPCRVDLCPQEPLLPPREPPIRYRAAIPTAWLEMTLTEGKNRQVRKMTAAVGFPTLRLMRVAIGGLRWGVGPLEGMQPGQWVELPPQEIWDAVKAKRGT